jgi:hypothetical protein
MTAGNRACYAPHGEATGAATNPLQHPFAGKQGGVRTDKTRGSSTWKPLEAGLYVLPPTGRWPHDKGPEQ